MNLSHNQLKSIHSNIFNILSNLEFLDLRANQLITLQINSFDGLSKLSSIYLSYNQLDRLTKDTFNGLSKLESITLAHNLLQEVTTEAFYTCTQPGHCIPVMPKLRNVFFDHNPSLNALPFELCKDKNISIFDRSICR